MASVTTTFTAYPTSYDTTNYSYYSVSNMSRGYTDSTSTTYATINNKRGANAETYVYWLFDTSTIPDDATIVSVSIKAKTYASGSTSNIISKKVQAFTGTTAKGTASNMTTTAREVTLSVGTWTLAELRDARVRVYALRANNTSTDGAIRFYGATLTVTYSVSTPGQEIFCKQNGSWVSVDSVYVKQNGVWVQTDTLFIKDNGTWKS